MDEQIARRSLAGEWEFRAASDPLGRTDGPAASLTDAWLPAEVPGDVYHDLLRAGEIPDPFVGENELDLQWVGETDWTYRRTFDVDAGRLEHDEHRLVFECLDTVAEVSVNGERVGTAENAHRRHAFDVGEALESGENEFVVAFESPVRAARERAAAYDREYPATEYPVQQPHRNLLRKPQCHFGWDWGVCLPTVGVAGDAELVSFSAPRITDVAVGQAHRDGGDGSDERDGSGGIHAHDERIVDLTVDVRTEAPAAGDYQLRVAVPEAGAATTAEVTLDAGVDLTTVELAVEDPELWWPANHGDQPLYDLEVAVAPADASDHPCDAATERIGIREVELRREPDEHGESFEIVVNGRPVFASGANWIPADGIPSRVGEADYRQLLESAVDANMNAIRVWGGGQYEREAFYEACDELGLLVWQDLLFACAAYPADEAFVAEVEAEVRHQVRRLASHPSVALWCGNNEVESLLPSMVGEDADLAGYRAEHDALFREALPAVVREADPDERPYWPTSPGSRGADRSAAEDGAHRRTAGDGAPDAASDATADPDGDAVAAPADPHAGDTGGPNDHDVGDAHRWDVWHGREPFSAFLDEPPRFVSEFGYQSFPSVETLRTVLDEDDLNPTAPAMEHHQRCPGGNARILQRLADLFRVPWSFADLVYLSQVQQALAIRTAVEHWRRSERCAGALFWQLNDLWPVASWSAIEYGGRWKALQHAARRFFAPVLVSTVRRDASGRALGPGEPHRRTDSPVDSVEVWVSTDGATAADGAVDVVATTLDGEVLHEERAAADVEPLDSACVATLDVGDLDAEPENVLVRAALDGDDPATDAAGSHPAFAALVPFKHLALPAADLDVRVDDGAADRDGAVSVAAPDDAPALFVQLDPGPLDGHFTDNWFHLTPDEERTVRFRRRGAASDGERPSLADALSVRHLRETY